MVDTISFFQSQSRGGVSYVSFVILFFLPFQSSFISIQGQTRLYECDPSTEVYEIDHSTIAEVREPLIIQPSSYIPIQVTKVVDGDTFYGLDCTNRGDAIDVQSECTKRKYRLIGVNTPEFSHFGRPEQPFAQEATDYLSDLIGDKQVYIKYDLGRQDKYKRDLVYVTVCPEHIDPNKANLSNDCISVNHALVRDGWAQVMTITPNISHADDFVDLQRQAREKGRGLWETTVSTR